LCLPPKYSGKCNPKTFAVRARKVYSNSTCGRSLTKTVVAIDVGKSVDCSAFRNGKQPPPIICGVLNCDAGVSRFDNHTAAKGQVAYLPLRNSLLTGRHQTMRLGLVRNTQGRGFSEDEIENGLRTFESRLAGHPGSNRNMLRRARQRTA